MNCNQKDPDCELPPAFRFTWPGREEAFICVIHVVQLEWVARGMGLPLQIIPLTIEDYLKEPKT